jgi:bifunctional pyridoxal-dependent enzyme with beta-cystathionase and maltose regulon repressor activities
VPVQARELTQAQTILQNQISNFAEGSSHKSQYKGGKLTIDTNVEYLKLNYEYLVQKLLHQILRINTSLMKPTQLRPKVIATDEGVEPARLS